jgi:hypothetical protein
MSQFDWPITQRNETMKAAQNRRFSIELPIPPLLPTYSGGKRTTFVKAYGIEVRCYLELFGKHVRNLRTLCFEPPPPLPQPKQKSCLESWLSTVQVECEEWTVLTSHQTQTWKKKLLLSPPPAQKEKKGEAPSLHNATSHWLHETFIRYNWLRLFLAWTNSPSYEHPTYIGPTLWECSLEFYPC